MKANLDHLGTKYRKIIGICSSDIDYDSYISAACVEKQIPGFALLKGADVLAIHLNLILLEASREKVEELSQRRTDYRFNILCPNCGRDDSTCERVEQTIEPQDHAVGLQFRCNRCGREWFVPESVIEAAF